ncbi:hypothetical protein SLEP1_g13430 [Rubroshorea leprosula]|uniref:Uncharacterized protein n=1 Tax=Rubroshorea leprosula TaxID=152421 RepID=A0AAV5IKA9_9ROSI|nr:hypothetical protein SLEP1_g13430 [Rubroshorea leprosula]
MAQHSLIGYCLKAKTSSWTTILRCLDTEDILGKFWWATWKQVNLDEKNFILSHLLEKFKQYKHIKEKYGDEESDSGHEVFDYEVLLGILKERGNHVFHSNKTEFKWSIDDVEFSHSILLWHIATFLLFYNDHKKYSGGVLGPYCQISKLLSDYMMYLLLVRPLMLPKGIGEVRITDTREEVIRLLGKGKSLTNNDATSALLHINYELGFLSTHNKLVLRDGCKLALKLQGLVEELR